MKIFRSSFKTTLLLTALLIPSVAQPMKRRLDTTNLETTSKKPKLDTTSNMIKLQASDFDEVIVISREALSHCPTLQNMLEDLGGAADLSAMPIPVHTSYEPLQQVVACLNIIQDGNDVANALKNYVQELDPQALHALLLAANYLDIKRLLDVCVKAWAIHCSPDQDVTSEQILHVSNDKNVTLLPEINHGCAQQLPYLPGVNEWLLKQMVTTLQGHNYSVNSVCFNHDGTSLATGSGDDTINLWNVATGTCTATLLGHNNLVLSVCFNHDGTILATGSKDNTIKLWNVATGTCTATFEAHNNLVCSVCFNHDGTSLATGSGDDTIKLWNVATGTCTATLQGHNNLFLSVCFNQDGTILASGSWDGTIKLWNVATGDCTATLQGHNEPVKSVCFNQDGTILATGSYDQTIKLWKFVDGVLICTATLQGHNELVKSVCFNQDGTLLASGSTDGTIKLWNVVTGACTATLQDHNRSVGSVCFNHDSTILASGSDDKTIKLWNIAKMQEINNFFDQGITLEQAMFLKLVYQANAEGEALNLTQNNQAHLLVIFKSLPEWLQEFLIEEGLIKIPS